MSCICMEIVDPDQKVYKYQLRVYLCQECTGKGNGVLSI